MTENADTVEEMLPAGIWFDIERARYRVRVYVRGQVVWRSYHKRLDEALNAYARAKETQTHALRHQRPPPIACPQTIMDLIR